MIEELVRRLERSDDAQERHLQEIQSLKGDFIMTASTYISHTFILALLSLSLPTIHCAFQSFFTLL